MEEGYTLVGNEEMGEDILVASRKISVPAKIYCNIDIS